MIIHSVLFRLKADADKEAFLKESEAILAPIKFARSFAAYREISAKNDFEFAFSFTFDSMDDYAGYNAHPDHQAYLVSHWQKYVEDFLETDWTV